ncbi:MAG: bifunctional demethylmenaquinone methyltransferase/2-methoxy-6-polyprenyl-1,4-benzoquinol methylase UbiE [Bacteroidota bacterium]
MIKPYQNPDDKKNQVRNMFDRIAWRYDFLNHFLSVGIDRQWRKQLVSMIARKQGGKGSHVLDLATGTGDLVKQIGQLNPEWIIGGDISPVMLQVAENKIKDWKLTASVDFQVMDGERLPFEDGCFDIVTIAFGIRNFDDIDKGLGEIYRVLKNGGRVYVLEFSRSDHKWFRMIFEWYFSKVLPCIGGLFSRHKEAYKYLPRSVIAFPSKKEFIQKLNDHGFINIESKVLTLGIVGLFSGEKDI